MSYLGVDIGTSGCKAVLFTDTGQQLYRAHQGYALRNPQIGWAELDSHEVINSCCKVIAEAVASSPSDTVRALAISSQGEAFTPVNKDGKYLCNALVSSDTRAKDLIPPFVESFGLDRLYQITGHTPSTLFSLFKLLWIKENQADLWQERPRFLCFEDLLQLRLGISPAMGWPLAGRTMLFDVNKHVWSEEILQTMGLEANQLSKTLPSGSIAGVIPPEIARDLGLPDNVKVVTAGHDQTIAALGAGVHEEGTAMYAAGTVECLCPVVPNLTLSPELCQNNLCSYDYSTPGNYTSVAYSLTGSNLLQYFKEEFAADIPYDQLLAEMPEEPSKLISLPYFTPSGTPYFDQDTPGVVLGWRLSTSRGELLKALIEGIAMEMKLNLMLLENSNIKINRLIATGGGSRSRKLVQLKADILNKPMEVMQVDEAGCLGAALLAQSADTEKPIQELVKRCCNYKYTVKPNNEQVERYQNKFTQYGKFYANIKQLSTQLWSNQ